MTDQHRDPGPDTNGTGKSEHIVHTTHVRESGGMPATGFIVGGLVVAVAIIAFFVFGDTGRQSAEINMPPTVENTINQAPDAAPEPNATPSTDTPDASGGSTATTPPNPDSGSTN